MTSELQEFLKAVDEDGTPTQVVEAAFTVLKDVFQIEATSALDGVSRDDIDATYKGESMNVAVKAFLKRAANVATLAGAAKRMRLSSPASVASGSPLPPQAAYTASLDSQTISELVGPDASSMTIAKLLALKSQSVDIPAKLKGASLDKLPYHLQAGTIVWRILEADNASAIAASRKTAFAYVDLTAKELLPLWLPYDAVGGKNALGSEWQQYIDPQAASNTIAQLGQALQAATSTKRYFRSFAQWNGAFLKYAAVAVSCGQLSWTNVLTHVNVVCQLHEQQRTSGEALYLPMLYDEFLRKQVARRAEQQDPELDLNIVFGRIDQQILDTCKSRLETVLATLGVDVRMSPFAKTPQPAASLGFEAAESMLAKQQAAADALQRRAETASRSLAKQQEDLNRKELQRRLASDEGISNRQAKSRAFLVGRQEARSSGRNSVGNGSDRGGYGGGNGPNRGGHGGRRHGW